MGLGGRGRKGGGGISIRGGRGCDWRPVAQTGAGQVRAGCTVNDFAAATRTKPTEAGLATAVSSLWFSVCLVCLVCLSVCLTLSP